jgi:type I restriction enzyme S subunit
MADWLQCTIGDLCDTISETYKRNDTEVVLINTSDVLEGKILNRKKVENKNLKGQFKKTFQRDDILYSEIRPANKRFAYVDFDDTQQYIASTKLMVLRPNPEKVRPRFLFAVLKSKQVLNELQLLAETRSGTFPQITFGSELSPMPIMLPSLNTQQKIIGILDAIEGKIEENENINKNLAEQIKTICTAWLSDYAPFGGILPNDWSEMSLSSIADFVNGYSYKGTELTESNIAMATIKNFDRKGGFKLDGYKEIIPSNKLKDTQHAELFDTLVAHTDLTQNAEVIGNAEPVMSKSGYDDIVFSMDLVKVVPKSKHISKFLIAAILQDKKFKAHCLGYVNGTTVLHLSKKALPEYQLYLPDDLSVLKPLDELVTALYQRISANIEEIIKLETLRDTLLPKLMSGELDVSNIDL